MSKATRLTFCPRPGTRLRDLLGYVSILAVVGLSATNALSQGTAYTGRSAGEGATQTKPVATVIRVDERIKKVTLVGHNDEGILFTESDTGIGTRLLL